MPGLKNIEGVEIFSAGTWNGDEYTVADLDEMVKAYQETSQTCRPYLKLGHDDEQKLLQSDGLPAAGWIGNLYRKGEKLVADFCDIPEKIYQLIENKAYRNVSSEIYWDIEMDDRSYKRMLAAVALLGADMPAVTNLNDILAQYKLKFKNIGNQKNYTLEVAELVQSKKKGAKEMPTIEELELEVAKFKADIEAKDKELADSKAQIEEVSAKNKEYTTQLAEVEKEKAEAKLELEVKDVMASEGACAAMEPYVRALLGEEKKVYSLESKELKKSELLKEYNKLAYAAAKLNTKETSIEGENIPQSVDQVAEMEKYMADNDCSRQEAYKYIQNKYKK